MEVKQISEFLLKIWNILETFIADKFSQHYKKKWQTLTKDWYILDIVKFGFQIEFVSEPCKHCNRVPLMLKNKLSYQNSHISLEKRESLLKINMRLEKFFTHICPKPELFSK